MVSVKISHFTGLLTDLKQGPRSICQKVVNTNLSGRFKFLNVCFGGGLRYYSDFIASLIQPVPLEFGNKSQ